LFLDADFRFMAASDLTNELRNPATDPLNNDQMSYKIVDAVLGTLQDTNGEVQNMGVKWYLNSRRMLIQPLGLSTQVEGAAGPIDH
jgi:hypothetical protein